MINFILPYIIKKSQSAISWLLISFFNHKTKEEVMKWMIGIQLDRRNLFPIQRIAIAEKYRPMYEKEAKDNQIKVGGDRKFESYKNRLR